MTIEIASGDHKLVIDPINGGRATEWYKDDLQILGEQGDHPLIGGWYLMAPWAPDRGSPIAPIPRTGQHCQCSELLLLNAISRLCNQVSGGERGLKI